MNLNLKMLKNDFKRNKAGNVSLLLFMTLAASLVVIATIVVSQLFTSMTGMYKTAMPPHFIQMHKGEINQELIDEFNSSYAGVKAWQTLPMIDVYGDDLTVYGDNEFNLSECRLDISLVKQNKKYDLLLDKERKIINVNVGEIGIPVILLDSYNIQIGDIVVLKSNGLSKKFKVTAFVHDAQMNSTLCSSTRMLISNEDFEELFGKVGEKEFLIETYFIDSSMASDFKSAYEKAGLPQSGQAVTYNIIFLLSAFRDISMAMVLILVSILLVIVAMMCIKYAVMASLEEEICEIGTMKAIGMSYKDIKNLYLAKYKMMMIIGILLGYLIALIVSKFFTSHVISTFGKQPFSFINIILPILVCILVFFITNNYCRQILKKLKKITVVDALVAEKGFGKKEHSSDGLYKSKNIPVNLLLSMWQLFHNFRGYLIVFMVMLIVSAITIVPVNLINTMESKEFISYMGSSMDDILIEIDSGENLENKHKSIINLLSKDIEVEEYNEIRRVRVEAINSEGKLMNIHIDCGNFAGQNLKYIDGLAPTLINEIALSQFNSSEISKKTGDTIVLKYNNLEQNFLISGIYQDVTSGGYTAKAINPFFEVDSEKYQFTIQLSEGVNPADKAKIWSNKIGGGVDIQPMQEYINQILGGVSRQIRIATTAVVIIGILIVTLIIILFMKLRIAKDISQIATLKALGFRNFDVRKQYLYKIAIVASAGILVGTLISNTMGESLVSFVLSMTKIGLTKITFIINPFTTLFILPLLLLFVAVAITWISTINIKKYNIISLINE